MTIKAIIFDMDGVIVDSIPMHLKIWKKMFEKRKIPFSNKIFEKYNGTSTYEIGKSLIKDFNLKETPNDIVKEKLEYELIYRKKEIKLFKKSIFVLKKLKRQGYKIALATSSKKSILNFILKNFDIKKYFDAISHAEEVKNSKPAPDIFLLAAKKIKINPENCIVVEDAINGIVAAKKAGMQSVAITTTFKKKVFVNKTKFVISSLDDLFDILEELKCVE